MRGCLLAVMCLLAGCAESQQVRIGWVTTEPNPAIGQTIVSALPDIDFELVTFNDKSDLRTALSENSIDLALLEKPERDHANLRTLLPVFESVLHVLVKTESGQCAPGSLFQDLEQKSVYAGPKGGAGHRVLEILAVSGLVPAMDRLRLLDSPFGEPPEIFFVFGGILSEDALSRLEGFCLRSLDDHTALGGGSTVEGLALRYPQLEPFLIPRSFYSSLSTKPTLTVSIKSLLVSHAQLDEDVAYEIVETVSRLGPTIRHLYPLTSLDLAAEHASESASLRLHPASLRFLNRDAPSFIERYAEVLAFSVTLIVALVTATVALAGQRRRKRKDRLDEYFVRLLEIRSNWETGVLAGQYAETQTQSLQTTVIQLLVDERIDADQALLSFLIVSNRLLSDLRGGEAEPFVAG